MAGRRPGLAHCKTADEAEALRSALADRLAACKLVLRPEKTKIVYCQDANRRGDFPNQSFDFLWFKFRARKALGRGRRAFACFLPAASPKALTSISQTIRRWTLHHRSDKPLQELAKMYNPYIQGWINYYGNFYRTLAPTAAQAFGPVSARCGRRASTKSCLGLTPPLRRILALPPLGSPHAVVAALGPCSRLSAHLR